MVAAVTAIIVSYNAGDDLSGCVGSLLAQECPVEIIVVDNGSLDGSVDRALKDHPAIRVLADGVNDGFAGGANRGAAAATADTLLFSNPDVVFEPGCVKALLAALDGQRSPAICGPVVVDDGRHSLEYGLTIDWLGDPVGLLTHGLALYVSGCALATTRAAFAELGGFDAKFFMFCEDLDYCWRALLHGLDVCAISTARVHHRGGGSASGGYVSGGRLEVTAFRMALRERNAMATLVRCAPLGWLALVVPIRLARIVVIALIAIISGRSDLARSLTGGVAWNVRRIPELVRQRRAIPASASMRRLVLGRRILRGVNSLRVLVRYGMPRFVDRDSRP